MLCSLGILTVTTNLVSLFFGDRPEILKGSAGGHGVSIMSAYTTPLQLATMLASIVATASCWWILQNTRWGVSARAIGNDVRLCECVGIRSDRVIIQALILGSALGGLGATLAALDTGVKPSIGFDMLLPGVVAAIVGASGGVSTVALAGFSVGLIQQYGGWFISPAWQDSIPLLVLIPFLLLRGPGWPTRAEGAKA
jgi:branched-subunit amino acid ABC-type transport system permease component